MVDFLGIGAQKSATSWLFQCMREHPRVCLAEEKELHYFSSDENYAKGAEWYATHWQICKPDTLKGEISTSYLSSPLAPERIKQDAPNAKLIALLRNPVDRAESHVRHLLSKKEVPNTLSLQELLAQRPDILENGRYATHLARYFALFPKEQIHIDTYDNVEREPLNVISRVDLFLGIDTHTPLSLSMHYNSSAFRATSLHDTANKTHQFLKQAPGGQLAINAIKALGFTSAKLAEAGHRRGEKSEDLFHFTPEDRQTLDAWYASELEQLAALGITFSSPL